MQNRDKTENELATKRRRLELYYKREAEMLGDGIQSYGIGSRNMARYNTDLNAIRASIKELEADIKILEGELEGRAPRFMQAVIPRDW